MFKGLNLKRLSISLQSKLCRFMINFAGQRTKSTAVSEFVQSTKLKMHRLERIVSNRGVGSRAEVTKWLRQGRFKVDGEVIRGGSIRYKENVEVLFDDEPTLYVPHICIYHKPAGVHCTMALEGSDRITLAHICETNPFLKAMHPVGRLDADTSGLLLFSRHGKLTNLLLDPATGVQREYEAVVAGEVDLKTLRRKLREGVKTADGVYNADLLESRVLDNITSFSAMTKTTEDYSEIGSSDKSESESKTDCKNEYADENENEINSDSMESPDDPIRDEKNTKINLNMFTRRSFVRLSVKEGKHRMVRRILHNSGHSVFELHRSKYGSISINGLAEGEVRVCTEMEHEWAVKMSTSQLKKAEKQAQKNMNS